MAASEFQKNFGNVRPENLSGTAVKWLELPVYTELSPGIRARVEGLSTLQGPVKTFVEQHRQAVVALVKQDKHFEAMSLVDQKLEEIEHMFSGDDAITARIFTYRRRGYIKEHLSTFGEFSKYPLGDSMRTISFLGGAIDYMQADLDLGCVTDYAARVSECFGGAGVAELQHAAAVKMFGDRVTIVQANSVDGVVVKDLVRRSIETSILGPVPGARDAKLLTIKDPNTAVN